MNKRGNLLEDFILYMNIQHPFLQIQTLKKGNGIRWKQFSQYIDKEIEEEIRRFLGENLSEFYWESSYQYVYINAV